MMDDEPVDLSFSTPLDFRPRYVDGVGQCDVEGCDASPTKVLTVWGEDGRETTVKARCDKHRKHK